MRTGSLLVVGLLLAVGCGSGDGSSSGGGGSTAVQVAVSSVNGPVAALSAEKPVLARLVGWVVPDAIAQSACPEGLLACVQAGNEIVCTTVEVESCSTRIDFDLDPDQVPFGVFFAVDSNENGTFDFGAERSAPLQTPLPRTCPGDVLAIENVAVNFPDEEAGTGSATSNPVTKRGEDHCVEETPAPAPTPTPFPPGTQAVLSVDFTGDANGRVQSSPPRIDCFEDCSGAFASGTTVRLVQEPVTSARFLGWGTDGDGDSLCDVDDGAAGCTVQMTRHRTVRPTFSFQ